VPGRPSAAKNGEFANPDQVSNPYFLSRPATRSMCGVMAVANGVE
jgi:hypothetical protein